MNVEFDARDIEMIANMVVSKIMPVLNDQISRKRDDEIMSVDELATMLRVEKTWVYRQVQLGEIPHSKPGKYIRFHRKEIDAWLARKSIRALGRDN